MFIILLLLLILIVYLTCHFYVHYGPNGRLLHKIPGPSGYPFIGNVLLLLSPPETLWKLLNNWTDQHYPISKIWAFLTCAVSIRHPDDLEVILKGKTHTQKSRLYDMFHPWLGMGLFTSGGSKSKSRRKILSPTFHSKILEQFIEILIREGESMTNSLKKAEGSITKDLIPFISEHTLNAICETAMGTSLRGKGLFQQQYRKAVHQMSKLIVYRLVRQWLKSDWIFSLTPKGREQAKILKILHGFTERITAERKGYHKRINEQYLRNLKKDIVANDEENIESGKKRLALLDFLIQASQEGLLTDIDIKEEVDTFMFAGHDTTSSGICFTLSLLAEHKDIQDRVRKEVDVIMRENQGKLTMKSLKDLEYLERCIKESLRLYPSAPFISRVTTEEAQLRSYLLPTGTILLLNIFGVHRDPHFWPNPEIFDPDRFLPETIKTRHRYSYLPFSAGPRKCIGEPFALMEMKAMIAPLIYNFYLEPIDYLKDIRIGVDIILRPLNSHKLKFIPIATKLKNEPHLLNEKQTK